MLDDQIIPVVQRWIERFVVEQNLCPFARRELEGGTVRYVLSAASKEVPLLEALESELNRLDREPDVETTFLIHPYVLQDFDDFNQFLSDCDRMLEDMALDGVYQIASFHPHYQFAETEPGDAENYSNRSPYPMLHILREASVERAVTEYPDVENIPARNIETLNLLGKERLQTMWQACFDE